MAYLSPRELLLLAPCRPELAPAVLAAMQDFENRTGHKSYVAEGFRTRAQQQADYDASFTNGVQQYRVAPPGSSRHELGAAADIWIVGVPDQTNALYLTLGACIERAGLKWGGRFGGALLDRYHAEINEPYSTAVAKWETLRKELLQRALVFTLLGALGILLYLKHRR